MKRRAIPFASAAFFVTSLALASDTWILDSSRSNARLFQSSKAISESANTGVARVTGRVKLDTNDLDASFFELSIYPADEDWGRTLSPEGTQPISYVPDATDHPLLTFKSTCILRTRNGELEVIGLLTLTRMERPFTATPIEDYAGPVHGDPVIRNETREITFLFPSASPGHISGALTPAIPQKGRVLGIVGSARIDRNEFPELLAAIKGPSWPPVVRSRDRHMPSIVGEEYSGAQCTPAIGTQTTIVLDLKFLHPVPEASVGMLIESGETR